MNDRTNKGPIAGALAFYLLLLLGATLWPFNFFQTNQIFPVEGGLAFSEPAMAFTRDPATGLETVTEFTLLVDLSTDIPGQAAWIFGYGLDFGKVNLMVGLYMNRLIVEVQRGEQRMRASVADGLPRGERTLLVIAGTRRSLAVFVDGVLRREVRRAEADSSEWNASYPILLGARGDGKYRWTGVLYSIRMLDYALSSEKIRELRGTEPGTPVLAYDFSEGRTDSVQNTGTGGAGAVLIPEQFRPRHRAILMDLGESGAPFPIWRDLVLNVLAFLPLGMMLSALFPGRVKPLVVLVVVAAAAFGLSLTIELLQAYLPRRWSTFTDVWTNTLGGLTGVLIYSTRIGRTAVQRITTR